MGGLVDSYAMTEVSGNKNIIEIFSSLLPPSQETEHIVPTGTLDGEPIYSINTKGDVLFGRFSFKLIAEEFDINDFELEKGTERLINGIEIQVAESDMYIAPSTFRFTDKTASDDATLKTLILSKGEKNEEPELDTYKEYELTPTFDPEKLIYERELLEYIDDLNFKLQTNDTKAKLKIKIPKRDLDTGELIFGEDETLQYEEKEIVQDENGAELNIKLNELGKESTKITIIVTSESGKKINEYKIEIKRPFATIKGSIYTAPTALEGKHVSDIRIYKSSDVENAIDLGDSSIIKDIHSTITTLESIDFKTNNDGTYEIYVIPGKYHILLDKGGFLDHIFNLPALADKEVKEINQTTLMAGDVNKDGSIDQRDAGIVLGLFGTAEGEELYAANSAFDFDENTSIDQRDMGHILGNFSKVITIETL